MTFETTECANAGIVEAFGAVYYSTEAAPLAWRELAEVDGTLVREGGGLAMFEGPDGVTIAMTSGDVETLCLPWEPE